MDPFVSKLRTAAKYMVCIMQDLSDVDAMPKSAKESAELLEHHEQLIRSVFEDQRLQSVQTDGQGILTCLRREEVHLGHSLDYRLVGCSSYLPVPTPKYQPEWFSYIPKHFTLSTC